jgi:hypothetical protein
VLADKGRDGNMNEMLAWYKEQDAQVYNPLRPELKTYTERDKPSHLLEAPVVTELHAIDRHHAQNGK